MDVEESQWMCKTVDSEGQQRRRLEGPELWLVAVLLPQQAVCEQTHTARLLVLAPVVKATPDGQ